MAEKGITLIGMSGSGKSTIGEVLADQTGMPLLDVDRWIEQQEGGMSLADVIATKGDDYELALEMRAIHEHDLTKMIVSPPGSIIYTDTRAMLQEQTNIVWLDVPTEILRERIETDPERQKLILGLAEKGVSGLLAERLPLYEEWADYRLDCRDKSIGSIVGEIVLRYL